MVGALAVFPLFGPEPQLDYLAFADGVDRGVRVHELSGGASVNDLSVVNPLDLGVLLYDGEEVLGAQQNRTFDVSVLVPAGAKLDVPVSCVEHGRWDGSRHGEAFASAPQAAYPELRRMKAARVREQASAGLEARAAQSEVWEEVAAKHQRIGTRSTTGAMHDAFEQRRDRLGELRTGIASHAGQVGMLAAVGGRFSVLDHVSRPEVFTILQEPLVQGYALDALEATPSGAPSIEDASSFVAQIFEQRLFESDGVGLGRAGRFEGDGVAGAALLCGNELVQLTAFRDESGEAGDSSAAARRARIRRHLAGERPRQREPNSAGIAGPLTATKRPSAA
ncbi:MAG: hypothetical protein AVDCRST_MAG45-2349 [uncultured Solirubrobacterales bacterium]|uniref:ARG and Rhodanese-Phosphatase-superfamily-associated domain-containing protein n=1 Tax=uncultured Solirubrobacterales bacterium TaxID=768556 RepID=A0A6J4TBT1_9ACTN|nr:MAG: hypothetical protein AVDCRST_MAG45-2349 [uncultured Solirubrobacterales bacterium]